MVLVTRRDLLPGDQLAQTAHALAEFAVTHRGVFERWQSYHKNIVILAAKDEKELKFILEKGRNLNIKTVSFSEPDIGNEMTAIALEPGEQTHKITSNLPLALREYGSN